jgi:hypothetical protein
MTEDTHFSVRQRLSGLKQYFNYVSYWSRVDFSQLKTFVIFLGNPRSGTTLVRSIVDAHPNAIIANELHTVRQLKAGASWKKIKKNICINSQNFKANPVWTDYSYRINGPGKKTKIHIIGDKRAAGTVHELSLHPHLIDELKALIPLPLKVIRCVRNPYDVIATRTRRNELDANENIERYFYIEQQAEQILEQLQPSGVKYVYNEELIGNSQAAIEDLASFLALKEVPGYIDACKSILYPSPNLSRYQAVFTPDQIKLIESETKKIPHLGYYLQGDRLPF